MLLISPAEEKFGGMISPYVPKGLPIAIGTLAGYLLKHGIETRIVDEEVLDLTPAVLEEKLRGIPRPYIIGLSCLTVHAKRAYALIRMIKALHPDAIVIAGGLHSTAVPEEPLERGANFVVRGEGEETLLHLYRMLRGAEPADFATLPGITWRSAGKIVHNPDAPLIANLDIIPNFPFHLFDEFAHRYDMGVIASSRGCPFRCNYCSIRMMNGLTYRYRSPERIMQEIGILVDKYRVQQILFYDDNFSFKKRRVKEFCDAVIAAGYHKRTSFTIQTRADNFYPDIVPLLAEAGFRDVCFGMETGVERLEQIISKGETVEVHRKATDLARRYGMSVSLNIIYGLPTETGEDREITYDVVKSMGTVQSKANNLIPYPGTPLYETTKDSDRIHILPDWSNFNSCLSVTHSVFDKTPLPYVPDTCSEFELKRDIIRYNVRMFLQPQSVLATLLGKKGLGWAKLPDRWYFSPRELATLFKIFFGIVVVNSVVAFLPLQLTEPIMNWLNPAMRRRPRLRTAPDENYQGARWSQESGTKFRLKEVVEPQAVLAAPQA